MICFKVIFILALLIHVSQAQTSPEDYLAPHNEARAAVNVGPMEWDDTVAVTNLTRRLSSLIHSTGRPYGENLAMSSGDLTAADAVKMWVDEIRGECLHYTQVVWTNSVRLGCASVTCDNGGTFVICSYDSPGNWAGERPY
ncbi:hypothetical protein MKX01_015372 [Papaver californicum]|nr:hypothetical protein MKX01_015372 [Papaver californicum]